MVLPDTTKLGDLRISDGIITEVSGPGTLDSHEGEMFVDGTGLHLLPGCNDPQVHFRDPGQPEKEDLGSGSAAAVCSIQSGSGLAMDFRTPCKGSC